MKTSFLTICFLCGGMFCALAQTGISVSPPRLYFEAVPGQTTTEKVTVTNASKKTVLDLSISLADWAYDQSGSNLILPADSLKSSFAQWVTVSEGSYFALNPGESKDLTVNVTVPAGVDAGVPVYTALLFVTQMNPVNDVDAQGSQIKLSVRSGIKLYCRPAVSEKIKKLEITALKFDAEAKELELGFQSSSNIWVDGIIYTDLLNTGTGKAVKVEESVFRTLPGDLRTLRIALPGDLAKGSYTATIMMDFGSNSEVEAAELKFTYE